ncbi:MAG: PAS domain-containing protein [Proteobacteria bacterium]|nr:PAS domain-containing protein [Pseudomonadota bacterium]MBU1594899.1 PAS domain-containing protein [Pseudomonadota bacterium]
MADPTPLPPRPGPQPETAPGAAARPRRLWSPATVLVALSAASALVFLFRSLALPEDAARLVVLGLALALAGGLLAQAVALRRARARLRAFELERDSCQASGSGSALRRAAGRVAVIATDPQGLVQAYNIGAEAMLGHAPGEVLGRMNLAEFSPAPVSGPGCGPSSPGPDPAAQVFAVLAANARQGGRGTADLRPLTWVRSDGRTVPIQLALSGVYSPQGALEGFLAVGLDLSDLS